MCNTFKQNTEGFTLVELLVVIAIIGLLSTLAVVALSNARQKARDSSRKFNIKQIANACSMYSIDNGHFPYGPGCDPDDPIHADCSADTDMNGAWPAWFQAELSSYMVGTLPEEPCPSCGGGIITSYRYDMGIFNGSGPNNSVIYTDLEDTADTGTCQQESYYGVCTAGIYFLDMGENL